MCIIRVWNNKRFVKTGCQNHLGHFYISSCWYFMNIEIKLVVQYIVKMRPKKLILLSISVLRFTGIFKLSAVACILFRRTANDDFWNHESEKRIFWILTDYVIMSKIQLNRLKPKFLWECWWLKCTTIEIIWEPPGRYSPPPMPSTSRMIELQPVMFPWNLSTTSEVPDFGFRFVTFCIFAREPVVSGKSVGNVMK